MFDLMWHLQPRGLFAKRKWKCRVEMRECVKCRKWKCRREVQEVQVDRGAGRQDDIRLAEKVRHIGHSSSDPRRQSKTYLV